jgi:hypothetical protein
MRGAPKAPRRDTRSPFLISRFRWRRDCLERRYITRRCASSVRWSTKDRAAPRRRSLRMSSRVLVCSAPEHSHELPPAADNRPAIPCAVSRRHALRDRFRKALPFPVPPIIEKAASRAGGLPCAALAVSLLGFSLGCSNDDNARRRRGDCHTSVLRDAHRDRFCRRSRIYKPPDCKARDRTAHDHGRQCNPIGS